MLSASVRSVCLRPFLHENPRPLEKVSEDKKTEA
ncbi:hypothetical protein AL1_03210 [Alistipes shahii WAL 8301]|uniref:Uncharacterized protein n=1 Tax=Alistipes shahii WAL 8301 TaxID=717959 RepID=D4IJ92_9BACT|nr:hypothetical protein AL1_03210 [Alistipes shahii WAL 8301]